MPRIALDISIGSPFRLSNLGQGNLSVASQAERKRREHEIAQRYHGSGKGLESLILVYSGGLESEGDRLLISFYRAIDDNFADIYDRSIQFLQTYSERRYSLKLLTRSYAKI